MPSFDRKREGVAMIRSGPQVLVALAIAAALALSPAAAGAQALAQVTDKVEATAQKVGDAAQKAGEKAGETAEKIGGTAGRVARQPAKDFGLEHTDIPPILADAVAGPYDLEGLGTCQALAAEVSRLNGALGPDYDAPQAEDDKTQHLANAGGNAVLSAVIPFRGVVREVSGAAAEQRALRAAMAAGYARRGFLRGIHQARNCHTPFAIGDAP